MSDVKDSLAEAMALNKRLAATLLVRKQELEAALAAAPDEATSAELARVDGQYQQALAEIAELRKLAGQAVGNQARAIAASALSSDPVLVTHEQRALENARAHLAELEAEAELGGAAEAEVEAVAAPAPAPAKPTREEADAQARAEFEALRARRGQPTPAAPGAPPVPPKKTM